MQTLVQTVVMLVLIVVSIQRQLRLDHLNVPRVGLVTQQMQAVPHAHHAKSVNTKKIPIARNAQKDGCKHNPGKHHATNLLLDLSSWVVV